MFWTKPRGRYISDWMQLKDGDLVDGYVRPWNTVFRRSIRNGRIVFTKAPMTTEVSLSWGHGRSSKLGYFFTEKYYDGKFNKNCIDEVSIFKANNFKGTKSMANKLLAALKLNKEERKLQKVGVLDENGNLTTDGQELLLNFLAKEHQEKLVEMTKDLIKDKKKCKDEED